MDATAAKHVLIYEYVEGMLERRAPYREAHLERIDAEREAGRILASGPYDPPTGALIFFADAEREPIEAFAEQDPYAQAGLISAWRVERWNGR